MDRIASHNLSSGRGKGGHTWEQRMACRYLHTLLGISAEDWMTLESILPRVKDVVRSSIEALEELGHDSST